jgi:hypothetical protein
MQAFIVCKVFDVSDFYILHVCVHGVDDDIEFIRYDCRRHSEQEAFYRFQPVGAHFGQFDWWRVVAPSLGEGCHAEFHRNNAV